MSIISNKRVFSNDKNINYQDYMNQKKGIALIHHQQSIGTQKLKTFLSYQDFLILTQTFFLYSQNFPLVKKSPFTIYQATVSKVSYEKFNHHISSCAFCLNVKDPEDFLKCREIQQILYPYGHFFQNEKKIYYPSTLDLTQWCNQCNKSFSNLEKEDQGENDWKGWNDDEDVDIPKGWNDNNSMDCPQIDNDNLNPVTGHKPNCECCKRILPRSQKNHCQLCMNTQSLFIRKR